MAKSLIIVDSCVFINAFRKIARAKSDLEKIDNWSKHSLKSSISKIIISESANLRIHATAEKMRAGEGL
jgi:hypothetical protein